MPKQVKITSGTNGRLDNLSSVKQGSIAVKDCNSLIHIASHYHEAIQFELRHELLNQSFRHAIL